MARPLLNEFDCVIILVRKGELNKFEWPKSVRSARAFPLELDHEKNEKMLIRLYKALHRTSYLKLKSNAEEIE